MTAIRSKKTTITAVYKHQLMRSIQKLLATCRYSVTATLFATMAILWQSQAFADTVNIVPIGDSITQGGNGQPSYRRALWQKLKQGGYDVDFVGSIDTFKGTPPANQNFDLDHEGHWAQETGDIAASIDSRLTGYTPDIAIIHLGTNDFDRGQSNASTLEELARIMASLRSDNPDVTVLVAEIIPMKKHDTASFNAALRAWAPSQSTSRSKISLVDQYTGYNAAVDNYDNYHPNTGGEEKIATRWFAALQEILNTEPVDSTLIGYWPFNEASGNTAKDLSPLGNTGTLGGNTWETRKTDTGVCFDGSAGKQMTTASGALPNPAAVTIAGWLKLDPTSSEWGWIGGYGDSAGLHANFDNKAGLTMYIYNGAGNWLFYALYGSQLGIGKRGLKDGLWHHVAGSYDPTVGFRLYVDGVLIGSKSERTPIRYTLGGDFVIAALLEPGANRSSRNLKGCVDEIAVYSSALSAAAIAALAQSEAANTAPVVSTGANQSITLPDNTVSTSVTDDGRLSETLSASWSELSGPDVALPSASTGTASSTFNFTAAGTYTIELSTGDGALSASDTVTITCQP